mmetsp:Transcript_5738/g.19888  ORF Transcript_5738/g.19888 Transcript_5738/m.19888 type:complete len:190 (+) Transcript_5738:110-679(+)
MLSEVRAARMPCATARAGAKVARAAATTRARADPSVADAGRPQGLPQGLALCATTLAALACVAVGSPSPATAGVVLQKQESKKVFQAEKKPIQPKGPRKPKAKKEKGAGMSLPAMSAPSVSVPSFSLGSGPLASISPIVGTFAVIAGAGFVATKVDDEFMDFMNEGMSKDVTTYAGYEEDLKEDSDFFN